MRAIRKLTGALVILVLFSANLFSQTDVGGPITVDTVWDLAGSPYIIKNDVLVSGGTTLATLTIEPGVEVQFFPERKIIIGSGVSETITGKLVAIGTEAAPIVFTTHYDGTVVANRWRAMYFNGNADDSSILEYCTFEYSSSAFHVYDSNPTFRNCTFENLADYGTYLTDSASPLIEDNTFSNVRTPVFIKSKSTAAPVITGNTFDGCTGVVIHVESSDASIEVYNNVFTNSTDYLFNIFPNQAGGIWGNSESSNNILRNFIWVNGGAVSKDASWQETGIKYIIASDVTVAGASSNLITLDIQPDVQLLFYNGADLFIGTANLTEPGKLTANGATFTSFTESVARAAGDWGSIAFNNSADDASVVDGCTIEYADTGIRMFGASPAITNNTISNMRGRGVFLRDDSSPVISGNVFDTMVGAVLVNNVCSGTATISENTISNCTGNAIQVDSPTAMPIITDNNFTNNETYLIDVYPDQVGNISGNTESSNQELFNRIFVRAGNLTQDAVWSETGIGYFLSGDVTIKAAGNTPTMTIEPGATLYFFKNSGLWVGDTAPPSTGKLVANGATFTAYKVLAPGEWHGIIFSQTADASSVVDGCTIEYAESAFKFANSSATISNNTVSDVLNNGVFIRDAGAPTVSGNTFTGMKSGVLMNNISTGAPVIENNTFTDLTDFGIKTDSPLAAPVVANNAFANCSNYLMSLYPNQIGNVSGTTSTGVLDRFNRINVQAGELTIDATWSETEVGYFLSSNLNVKGTASTATLTLEPSVTLYFFTGTGLWVGSPTAANAGQLIASGATFTTFNQIEPAAGQWNNIYFYDNADDASILDNCIVEYARVGASLNDCSPAITNTTFQMISDFGISLNGSSAPLIQGNTFTDMTSSVVMGTSAIGAPVIDTNEFSLNRDFVISVNRIEADPIISANNFFDNNSYLAILHPDQVKNMVDNTYANNGINQIYVKRGFVTEDAVWGEQNVGYFIFDDVFVEGANGIATLTLAPNTVLLFNVAADLIIGSNLHGVLLSQEQEIPTVDAAGDSVSGKLLAEKVLFTTSNKLEKAPGDWGSIIFKSQASDESAIIKSKIEYALFGIQVNNRHVDILLNTFENNLGINVYCYGGSPTIMYNTMTGAARGVYVALDGNPIINFNNITNTVYPDLPTASLDGMLAGVNPTTDLPYGVENVNKNFVIDARYNWWGDASGPAGVGPGKGTPVSDFVDFSGFLTSVFVPLFPPDAFSLLTPVDGSTIYTNTATFTWEPATDSDEGDVVSYELYLSTDAAFTTPLVVTDLSDTFYVWEGLTANQQYWWKVKAVDTNTEGTWSDETFTVTVQMLPPAAFSLLTPADDAVLNDNKATFTWQAAVDPDAGDAVSYSIYLSKDEAFTDPMITRSITGTSLEITELDVNQNYWWKVLAQDQNTTGTWSTQVFSFSVVVLPPSDFSLLTPADNDTLTATDATFTWQASTPSALGGALTYTLYLSTDAAFTTPQLTEGITTTTVTKDGLSKNQKYWWKVKAVDENSEGKFSKEVFSFFVKDGTGIAGEGSAIPTEFSISQNYPNPFNPVTSIRYGLPKSSDVKITIHNALGQQLEVLVDAFQNAGYHNISWNAVNYGSGVYFYKIQAGSFMQIHKAILTK